MAPARHWATPESRGSIALTILGQLRGVRTFIEAGKALFFAQSLPGTLSPRRGDAAGHPARLGPGRTCARPKAAGQTSWLPAPNGLATFPATIAQLKPPECLAFARPNRSLQE